MGSADSLFSIPLLELIHDEVRERVALELTRFGENPPEWIRQLVVREVENALGARQTEAAIDRRLDEMRGSRGDRIAALDIQAHMLTRESASRILVELKKFYARQDVALEFVPLREQPVPYPLAPETGLERSKTYFRNWARVRTSVPVRQIDQIFLVVPAPTGSAKMVPRPLVRMSSSAFEPHCLAAVDANPTVWTEVAGRDDCILVGPLPSPNYQFTLEYKERPRGEED